jgi:hypothetical protein
LFKVIRELPGIYMVLLLTIVPTLFIGGSDLLIINISESDLLIINISELQGDKSRAFSTRRKEFVLL